MEPPGRTKGPVEVHWNRYFGTGSVVRRGSSHGDAEGHGGYEEGVVYTRPENRKRRSYTRGASVRRKDK